jgi:hypothetical protein
MKRLLVLGVLVTSSIALTAAPSSAVEAVTAVPARDAVPVLVVPGQTDCEFEIRAPLTDMKGFRVVSSDCYYKEWILRGSAEGSATARGVMNYYSGEVRTKHYQLIDDISCRRRGGEMICSRSIVAKDPSSCTGGALITKLGPIRSDGRRPGYVRLWIDTGCG